MGILCCQGKRRTFAILTALSAFGLLGAAIYLFASIQKLVRSLSTVIRLLKSLSNVATSLGANTVDALPQVAVDAMHHIAPYLDFLSMGPALIAMVWLLLAALLGFGWKKGQRSFCCAKFFVLLSQLSLLLALGWYLLVVSAALLADRPVLSEQWAAFTRVCSDGLGGMQSALSDANAALTNYTDFSSGQATTPGQIATARTQLTQAQRQLDDFNELCSALSAIPEQVLELRGSGAAGLVATLFAYVAVNGLCCAAGCCIRQPLRVAPPTRVDPQAARRAELQRQAAQGEDKERGDEDDEDYIAP